MRPICLLLLFACADPPGPEPVDSDAVDSEPLDSEPADTERLDSEPPDSEPPDSEPQDTEPVDTEPAPVPVPLAGFGAITGDCGELDAAEWSTSDPAAFSLTVDFGTTAFASSLLSPGAQQILDEGTLGGSSGESEAISFDLLYRCELATLLKTETQITYLSEGGKKTDILVEIDGHRVGVSVTRALTFDFPEPCAPLDEAALSTLITRKVSDLPLSKANANPADAWERSMLYVIACDAAHAAEVERLFWALPANTRGDALLLIGTSDGEDDFLY